MDKLKRMIFLAILSFIICYVVAVLFTGELTIPEMDSTVKGVLFYCWVMLTAVLRMFTIDDE